MRKARIAKSISHAHLVPEPSFVVEGGIHPRRPPRYKRGLKYEGAFLSFLEQSPLSEYLLRSPWIQFKNEDEWELCQPDFLLVDILEGRVVIGEVKYAHTPRAWEQLILLYEPVVRGLFRGGFSYAVCEVVRWYDADTVFPVPVVLQENILGCREGSFNVHIWNPRGLKG